MYWKDVLIEMGFIPKEGYTNIYTNKHLGTTEFCFAGRESTDAIAAEIWDKAQDFGEKKMREIVLKNIFREL